MKEVVLLLAVVALAASQDTNQYCNLPQCYAGPHVLCAFTRENKCSQVGHTFIDSGLTQDEKDRILNLHNELRQKVARGKETRGAPGPQPAAESMPDLQWDDELAFMAQHLMEQCRYQHDKCRSRPNEYVGQNIAISGTTEDVYSITPESMVQDWFDEVQYFDGNRVFQPYRSGIGANGQAVGHYTQLVWAKTNRVGCGSIKYNDGKYNQFLLACNYGPGGNILDSQIYQPANAGQSRASQPRLPQPQPQQRLPQPQQRPPQPQPRLPQPQPQPQQRLPQSQQRPPQPQPRLLQPQPQQHPSQPQPRLPQPQPARQQLVQENHQRQPTSNIKQFFGQSLFQSSGQQNGQPRMISFTYQLNDQQDFNKIAKQMREQGFQVQIM